MALIFNPPTSLPVFTTNTAQAGNARYCEGIEKLFTNITPFTRIPPWVMITTSNSTVSSVKLTPVAAPTNYVQIVSMLSFDYGSDAPQYWKAYTGASVINPAGTVTPAVSGGTPTIRSYIEGYSNGPFYLEITAGASVQYTEWFYFEDVSTGDISDPCNAIILEWYDTTCEMGNLRYDLCDIRNKLYLKCDVGKPTYPVDEDGQEDGDKEIDPVFQKVRKVSRFECIIPEYLTDALCLLNLHDTIMLTDQFGDQYQIDNVEVSDPEWITGCLARIVVSYSISGDYIVKRCC